MAIPTCVKQSVGHNSYSLMMQLPLCVCVCVCVCVTKRVHEMTTRQQSTVYLYADPLQMARYASVTKCTKPLCHGTLSSVIHLYYYMSNQTKMHTDTRFGTENSHKLSKLAQNALKTNLKKEEKIETEALDKCSLLLHIM